MRRISTLALAFVALACFNQNAVAQTCTPIATSNCTGPTETFETRTDIASSGFSSSDFATDFTTGANADRFLQSTPVSSGLTKTLLSPTLIAPAQDQTLSVRFDLGGSTATLSGLQIFARTTSGDVLLCTGAITTIGGVSCFNFVVPSELAGRAFRFVFQFTIAGSNNQRLRFDDFGSNAAVSPIVLPVKFVGLEARKGNTGTQLTWKVADEVGVARYEIEKGAHVNSFSKIGSVAASSSGTYTFTDASVAPVSFYRIKSVDFDGKFAYSIIISLENAKSAGLLKAFPLPAQTQLTVQHASAGANSKLFINSEDGRVIKVITPASGSLQTPVDVSTLNAGLYLLRFDAGNGKVETLKFIKK